MLYFMLQLSYFKHNYVFVFHISDIQCTQFNILLSLGTHKNYICYIVINTEIEKNGNGKKGKI